MQNPKKLIFEKLKWILGEMGVTDVDPEVMIITDLKFGDYTSNAAMTSFKILKQIQDDNYQNPRDLAEQLALKLKESQEVNEIFDKIEVAGPGFINFFLSSNYLKNMLTEVVQNDYCFEQSDKKDGQRVIVEFGDPNPFKEIHIGHLRNFCIGESFSRLLESQGNKVIRANYQGDVGLHVAKALYGIKKQEARIMDESLSIEEKSKILAQSYSYGATEFESNDEAKQEIQDLNKIIYQKVSHSEQSEESYDPKAESQDDGLSKLWEEGRKVSLEHFEDLYKRIGVRYDKYYFESVTAKKGRDVVLSHIDDGVFERDAGAVVYRGEKDGLHTRVFLSSQDYATYEGKDLALAILKSEDESYDRSVILTGNEQLEYFQVMLAALHKIRPDLSEVTSHYTFGHVRLKNGKMSSRTGDVITANWLLDEAVKRVRLQFEEMDSDTAEKVGVGAVKYSMLKFSIPSDIHFSFEESITLEGNSGPYLQYTYVRTQSVLNKSKEQIENSKSYLDFNILNIEESELLRFISQYPYFTEIASQEFATNLLCNYLFELSQKFNLFYQKHKILGSENESFRLTLTDAVGKVIKNGLTLLGIDTVERM